MKNFDLTCYLVLGPENCQRFTVREVVRQAIQGGVTFIQLRSKVASAKEQLALAKDISDEIALSSKNISFVINDRVDLVWAAKKQGIKVDGVHLGQSDLDPKLARELLGKDAIIGLSAHLSELIKLSDELPKGTIDYLGAGPVHETQTKPDCGLTDGKVLIQGVEGVNQLAKLTSIPLVAGGGVKVEDVRKLAKTNVAGFFVVTAITDSNNPQKATSELLDAWKTNKKV